MRVVFMGTPDFAAASLNRLLSDQFDICAVYTQPDRPKGRGMNLAISPVKQLALDHGIPVLQPDTLQSIDAVSKLNSFQPDIIVVVAYGKILPDSFLQAGKYGAVNLHGSLLPKYRGAAPIQWAVLNGDQKAGVCTIYLSPEMDAGDLIYSEATPIGEYETAGELFDRLKDIGATLLSKTLRDIESGTAPRIPQDHSLASYVSRLDKTMSPIDWTQSPRTIVKHVCGLQPWPVATTDINGVKYKIFEVRYSSEHTDAAPGTILKADNKGLLISCGKGETLMITQLQAPGKKRMSVADYLRGHPISL